MCSVSLVRAGASDAFALHVMQREAFAELLGRYRDYQTSPANEPLSKVEERLSQRETFFYFILASSERVGAIRIVDRGDGSTKRISPVFILPGFRRRGCARAAILEAERIHGTHNWSLDTIAQEAGNRRLYESLGYCATGEERIVNERMTLIFYRKA